MKKAKNIQINAVAQYLSRINVHSKAQAQALANDILLDLGGRGLIRCVPLLINNLASFSRQYAKDLATPPTDDPQQYAKTMDNYACLDIILDAMQSVLVAYNDAGLLNPDVVTKWNTLAKEVNGNPFMLLMHLRPITSKGEDF